MSLTGTALELLTAYGYLAVFVFLFLETSMVFPWLPSEVVVPAAAALLVRDPLSLGLFVAVATAGGVVGSLFAFFVFREAGHLVDRYGHYVRVSQADLDRGRRWFREWGESSVLWGRFLPVLRTVISVPAGLARMDVRKFALYSGVGTALFTAAVGALVAVGRETLPTEYLLGRTTAAIAPTVDYLAANPPVAVGLATIVVVVTAVGGYVYDRLD